MRAPCAPELAHEPAHHQHHASRAPPGPPPPPPDVLRRAERLAGFLASMSPRTTCRTAVAASQPAQRPVLGNPGTAATPSAFPSIIPHSSTHLHPQTPPSSTSAACADPPSPQTPIGRPPAPPHRTPVGRVPFIGVALCVYALFSSLLPMGGALGSRLRVADPFSTFQRSTSETARSLEPTPVLLARLDEAYQSLRSLCQLGSHKAPSAACKGVVSDPIRLSIARGRLLR